MRSQKTKKTTTKAIAQAIFSIAMLFSVACVSPQAIQTKLGAVEGNLQKLQKVVDNKADVDVVAKQIGEVNTRIDQNTKLIENTYNAETIKFSGAGWVVLGSCLIIAIFLGAFGLLIRMLLQKASLLKLVTCAISKVPYDIKRVVKDKIEEEVSNGGPFSPKQKYELEKFTKKHGTFAEDQ